VAAIEAGFVQSEIEDSAYEAARAVDAGDQIVVGVNDFVADEELPIPLLTVDPVLEREQMARLATVRSARAAADVDAALEAVAGAAAGDANLLHPMKTALAAGASVGEVSDVLRAEFGEYRPTA
jgi:methylmalonyl-CoA mutase N-terminal domain/subunit